MNALLILSSLLVAQTYATTWGDYESCVRDKAASNCFERCKGSIAPSKQAEVKNCFVQLKQKYTEYLRTCATNRGFSITSSSQCLDLRPVSPAASHFLRALRSVEQPRAKKSVENEPGGVDFTNCACDCIVQELRTTCPMCYPTGVLDRMEDSNTFTTCSYELTNTGARKISDEFYMPCMRNIGYTNMRTAVQH